MGAGLLFYAGCSRKTTSIMWHLSRDWGKWGKKAMWILFRRVFQTKGVSRPRAIELRVSMPMCLERTVWTRKKGWWSLRGAGSQACRAPWVFRLDHPDYMGSHWRIFIYGERVWYTFFRYIILAVIWRHISKMAKLEAKRPSRKLLCIV